MTSSAQVFSDSLIAVLDRLRSTGLSFDGLPPVQIQSSSFQAAKTFLKALSPRRALPKVAPDGDGGFLLVWEEQGLLLTIDQWKLHAVVDPATPHAVHVDDVPFDGEVIPKEILLHIPLR